MSRFPRCRRPPDRDGVPPATHAIGLPRQREKLLSIYVAARVGVAGIELGDRLGSNASGGIQVVASAGAVGNLIFTMP
jgi:hypothetical protein